MIRIRSQGPCPPGTFSAPARGSLDVSATVVCPAVPRDMLRPGLPRLAGMDYHRWSCTGWAQWSIRGLEEVVLRSPSSWLLLVVAWLIPAGVLVQAVLAGQAMFVTPDLFELHGGVGHGVLALSVVAAGLAWSSRWARGLAVLATVALVVLISQTGLGYAGRHGSVAQASVWHLPLGVAVVGLTVAVAILLSARVPRPSAMPTD